MKVSNVGLRKSLIRQRIWKERVRMKVVRGEMSGRTAKAVSPIRPRVTLFTADWSMVSPRRGATAAVVSSGEMVGRGRLNTIYQDSIREGVHSPNVRRPVRMAQPSAEGKQPRQHLGHLPPVHERPKRRAKDPQHTRAQLYSVPEADIEDRVGTETVRAEEEDKVRRRKIQVDVLHTEKRSEQKPRDEMCGRRPREHEREEENAVHEAIVLEVDVVDYQ